MGREGEKGRTGMKRGGFEGGGLIEGELRRGATWQVPTLCVASHLLSRAAATRRSESWS